MSAPISCSVNRISLQDLARDVFLDPDSFHIFVRTLRYRRERMIQGTGRVNDHRRALAWRNDGGIDETRPYEIGDNGNLPVWLYPRGQSPEDLRRVIDVNILIKNKDVLTPIDGQYCGRQSINLGSAIDLINFNLLRANGPFFPATIKAADRISYATLPDQKPYRHGLSLEARFRNRAHDKTSDPRQYP